MNTKVDYFVYEITPEQLLGQRVESSCESSPTSPKTVRDTIQLDFFFLVPEQHALF